jgi:glucose dehydrogenase
VVALLGGAAVWVMPRASGQAGPMPSTANGDWVHYTADVRGSRYTPLDRINASNFSELEVAWRFKTDSLGTRPEYDKQTGKEVGTLWMPAPQSGSPMSYMANGRQYIIVAVSGGVYSGEYIAFALPQNEMRPASQQ